MSDSRRSSTTSSSRRGSSTSSRRGSLGIINLFMMLLALGALDMIPERRSSFSAMAAPVPSPPEGSGFRARSASVSATAGTKSRVGIVIKQQQNKARHASSAFENFIVAEADRGQRVVPLKRVGAAEEDLVTDSAVLLQRHINRGVTKLAAMQRRDGPSSEELQQAVQRRMEAAQQQERGTGPRFVPHRGRIGVKLSERHLDDSEGPMGERLEERDSDGASGAEAARIAAQKSGATKSSSSSEGFSKTALAAANSDKLLAATPPDSGASLGLDIEANDVGYIATVQVGSAKTPFRMLIDSGSADTWVPGTACKNCGDNHQKLGKKLSSSFKGTSTPFSITYGTGAVSGVLASDDLTIAGLKLKNKVIGLVHDESQDFSDPTVPFDGLMGLAQQKLSNSGAPTPIDSLYSEKLVPAPVMGYHLGRAADKTNDGEVTFGGVDASSYVYPLLEIPNVSKLGFWEIGIEGVSFGGKSLSGLAKGRTAILDTGTTLIIAPQADADAVHAAIPGSKADGQGGYTIPCTTAQSLSFRFGGQDFAMDSRDLKFLPVDNADLKGDCISAISAGDVGQAGEWLVGAAFLKNVYFATNTATNTVGLAKLKA